MSRTDIWSGGILAAPSLISCCDMCRVEESVRELEKAGIQALHIDILDGHFSPSMPLGLDTVRALRERTDLLFDVHLMASRNDFFVEELLDIGVDQLIFHAETEAHIDRRLAMIHERGVRAGIALKPSTPLQTLEYVIDRCDVVLLMLINPGYASSSSEGQVSYGARKICDLRKMITERGASSLIEIDGRVSREDIARYGGEGTADVFVAGSTCLDCRRLFESARSLRQYCEKLTGDRKDGRTDNI